MPAAKSPRKSSRIDYDKAHKIARHVVGVAILATFITTVVYAIMTGGIMLEVHDEGSNPYNSTDTSLTDKEQGFQINSLITFTFFLFTLILTLIYISMK